MTEQDVRDAILAENVSRGTIVPKTDCEIQSAERGTEILKTHELKYTGPAWFHEIPAAPSNAVASTIIQYEPNSDCEKDREFFIRVLLIPLQG